MDELISRQAAIDTLIELSGQRDEWESKEGFAQKRGIDAAICAIEDLPSAERRGRWIVRDNPGTGWYRITCSECGEDVTSTAPCIGFFPDAKVMWNYCPDCGAKMEV